MSRSILLPVLLSLLLSCEKPGRADGWAESALLIAPMSPADTLQSHLVRRLRHLLEAATAQDSASIANLITADFVAVDSRVRSPWFTRQWTGEELTYWQVVAGRLSDRFDHDYSDFSAEIKGDVAHVFAFGLTQDISTVWSYRETSWRANNLWLGPHNPNWRSMLAERVKKRSR
jgi:hypothetical protein